jgi:hypothetical protein
MIPYGGLKAAEQTEPKASAPVAFEPFPKLARYSREVVVTEKIDGTNAQVFVRELPDTEVMPTDTPIVAVHGKLLIYAGSRNRWLTPQQDNFGFARWVLDNAEELATLGPGRHFGEWWGQGIQRGYGLKEKRFSLFNVSRWNDATPPPACCHVVPVLQRIAFDDFDADFICEDLRKRGSVAAPGYMKPEGLVVFHVAGGVGFKKTLEKDEQPKSAALAPNPRQEAGAR